MEDLTEAERVKRLKVCTPSTTTRQPVCGLSYDQKTQRCLIWRKHAVPQKVATSSAKLLSHCDIILGVDFFPIQLSRMVTAINKRRKIEKRFTHSNYWWCSLQSSIWSPTFITSELNTRSSITVWLQNAMLQQEVFFYSFSLRSKVMIVLFSTSLLYNGPHIYISERLML